MLDYNMRLFHFIKFVTIITIDWSGVDARVNPEESHADLVEVAVRECPETTIGVPVFRTDTIVHNECPLRRDGKD